MIYHPLGMRDLPFNLHMLVRLGIYEEVGNWVRQVRACDGD